MSDGLRSFCSGSVAMALQLPRLSLCPQRKGGRMAITVSAWLVVVMGVVGLVGGHLGWFN